MNTRNALITIAIAIVVIFAGIVLKGTATAAKGIGESHNDLNQVMQEMK